MFSGKFPEGLRVLIFDEDPQYLLTLEKHLQAFNYKVTRCKEEEIAMYLLRNRRDDFDIAIIEVQNYAGDRSQNISQITSEIDLPIILMSKDKSLKSVFNWMLTGACDYLIKPIDTENLRLIFKHVAKKIQDRRNVVVAGETEEKAVAAAAEKSSSVGDTTIINPNKRERSNEEEEETDLDRDKTSTSKKRRVVWTEYLHKKFVDAYNSLGDIKAVPKKILEKMNVKGITRENVASHLQKYRMNLKKKTDQNAKEEERNQSLIIPQEIRMYSGDEARDIYRGKNVQFQTDHIHQPTYLHGHHQLTNPSFITQHVLPFENHHHNGVSTGRNQVMITYQHQTSGFRNEEENFYCNPYEMVDEYDDEVANLLSTHRPEDISLVHGLVVPNDHMPSSVEFNSQQMISFHESSNLLVPSFPSYPLSFPFDQEENLEMENENVEFNKKNGDSNI